MKPVWLMAHLRYRLHQHGWPAAAGLALLLAALGVMLLGVVPMQQKTAQMARDQAPLRLRMVASAEIPDADASQAARAGLNSLPDAAQALDVIASLHSAAQRHGVALASGEYRVVREGKAPWQRYRVSLPARGTYPQLRAWMAEWMNASPAVVLDEFGLRRDDVAQDTVEARIQLSLFVRVP